MPRRSPESPAAGLECRIVFSVAELARAGNVPPYRLLRILRRHGVTFVRMGRAYYVALDEIRRKIPVIWKSFRAMETLRRGAGAPDGERRDRSPRAARPLR